jgi:hypothetical protein
MGPCKGGDGAVGGDEDQAGMFSQLEVVRENDLHGQDGRRPKDIDPMDEVSYHGARLPWKEATGSKCQGVLKPVSRKAINKK